MDLLVLILIPIIYLAVAFIKPYLQPKMPFKICAICIAVSLMWLLMLVLWIIGIEISLISLGILMGMSVSGIMYSMESIYKENSIRNFWFVRLVVVVGGFYSILKLLNEEWNWLLLIVIIGVVAVAIASLFFQKTKRTSDLTKRLDDCC